MLVKKWLLRKRDEGICVECAGLYEAAHLLISSPMWIKCVVGDCGRISTYVLGGDLPWAIYEEQGSMV